MLMIVEERDVLGNVRTCRQIFLNGLEELAEQPLVSP